MIICCFLFSFAHVKWFFFQFSEERSIVECWIRKKRWKCVHNDWSLDQFVTTFCKHHYSETRISEERLKRQRSSSAIRYIYSNFFQVLIMIRRIYKAHTKTQSPRYLITLIRRTHDWDFSLLIVQQSSLQLHWEGNSGWLRPEFGFQLRCKVEDEMQIWRSKHTSGDGSRKLQDIWRLLLHSGG